MRNRAKRIKWDYYGLSFIKRVREMEVLWGYSQTKQILETSSTSCKLLLYVIILNVPSNSIFTYMWIRHVPILNFAAAPVTTDLNNWSIFYSGNRIIYSIRRTPKQLPNTLINLKKYISPSPLIDFCHIFGSRFS